MASYEGASKYEQNGMREFDSPASHMEGLDSSQLEGMTDSEKHRFVGEYYFDEEVSTSSGLMEGFQEVSEHGTKEEFSAYYERYIEDSYRLLEKEPEVYKFFKDRIFYGREYGLSGMEAFMNRTAPERIRGPLEQKSVEAASLLPKTEIQDGRIGNCSRPFSYGDVEQMAKKMDFHKGDSGLLPIAPDRMVACRNLMALCGKEFTESDVTKYAVGHEYMAYDPLYLKGFSHNLNDMIMPDIIRGMSGIETYEPNLSETGDSAETIASQLDQGYRGLVVYNSGILNRTSVEAETPAGKLADNLPFRSANEASTLECAVRDGNTGKVKGFYICDSTANDAKRYVEADRMMKALNVKNGTLLLTSKPYLDK